MLLFSFSSFQNIYQNIYCSSTLRDLTHPLWKLEDKCVVYERN